MGWEESGQSGDLGWLGGDGERGERLTGEGFGVVGVPEWQGETGNLYPRHRYAMKLRGNSNQKDQMKELLRVSALLMVSAASATHAQDYSFTLLDSEIAGTPYGAVAHGISGDGQVIAGGDTRYQLGEQPFVWRKVNGVWVRTQLPVPAAPQNFGRAMTLSFDGNVIGGMVGSNGSSNTPNYGKPAIWRNVLSGQPELILIDVSDITAGYVGGVSDNGESAAWWGSWLLANPPFQDLTFQSQVWVLDVNSGVSTPRAPLSLPADPSYSMSNLFATHLMSGDGSLIALSRRYIDINRYPIRAFVLDGGELLQLPEGPPSLDLASPLTGAGPHRQVNCVSRDGLTIVGSALSDTTSMALTRALRWTRWGDLTVLPMVFPFPVPSATRTLALGVSGDGQVIAGSQHASLPFPFGSINDQVAQSRAVVLVNSHPRTLQSLLARHGVSTGEVIPALITNVSEDGSTLVGFGLANSNSNAPLVSFVATILPPGVCDDIDFNRDGSRFDPVDIDAFLSVYSEGPCLPAGAQCRDIDFNNDGSLFDPRDIEAFLSVFSEGPCL